MIFRRKIYLGKSPLLLLGLASALITLALIIAGSATKVKATHSAGEADVLTRPANCAAVVNGRCLRVGYWGGELRMNPAGFGVQATGVAPGSTFTQFGRPSAYWGNIQDANANSVNEFIDWHRFTLTDPGGYCAVYNAAADPYCASRVQSASAYIVNSMLGVDGNSFGCASSGDRNPGDPVAGDGPDNCRNAAFSRAISLFGEWEKVVRFYESRDWIRWHGWHWQPCGEINTSAVYGRHANFPRDVVQWDQDFFCNRDVPVIRFVNPSGGEYIINKECANSKGFAPLSTYDNQAQIFSPGFSLVNPGGTYTVQADIFNVGADTANNVTLVVDNQGDAYTINEVANPTIAGDAEASRGYNRSGDYFWNYGNNLTSGDRHSVTLSFTVDPGAPRTSFCLYAIAVPRTPTIPSYTNPQPVCFTINAPQEPYLTTEYGSLHAGAEWGDQCFTPGARSGSVTGRVRNTTGSKADYIVSAGGEIRNFGSAGLAAGNSLTFGNIAQPFGKYGTVCRPDLARRYLDPTQTPAQPLSGNSFSVATLNNTANGIYRVDNGADGPTNVTLSGGFTELALGKRITLVVRGDVYITSDIRAAGSNLTGIADIPSLGIIASGNIHIHPNVQQIYGIYYAGTNHSDDEADVQPGEWSPGHAPGGIINTCRTAPPYSADPTPPSIVANAASCNRVLQVNGAFIANNIYFRRTAGDARAGTSHAERISYLPQLILRPPLGMGGVSSQIRSAGERPPIF